VKKVKQKMARGKRIFSAAATHSEMKSRLVKRNRVGIEK
jgi:guanylate kinase